MLKALRDDWILMDWLLATGTAFSTFSTSITAYKIVLRSGGNLGAVPTTPTVPAAPTATSGGMEKRFRDLIQDAVRSGNLTDAIAKDLGIVAPDESSSSQSREAAQPSFKLSYSSGGYPLIIWKKGKFEGVEIHKSKDGINFSKLDRDYKPDYIDKSDLPEPTKAEVWYYKLIYLMNEDEQTGQWSDVQSISVHG